MLPYLPEAIDFTNITGSVDYWLNNRGFAESARAAQLLAFVFWGGVADISMSPEDYTPKLRALIGIARSGNSSLPVRIVEIIETPNRATIRAAQREVANDPGVELIPTADLPFDEGGHHTADGYRTVRDRIYRSLGR